MDQEAQKKKKKPHREKVKNKTGKMYLFYILFKSGKKEH